MTSVFSSVNMLISGSALHQRQPQAMSGGGALHAAGTWRREHVCFRGAREVSGGERLLQIVVRDVELEYAGRRTSVLL
eukprot:COSAG02_NODE_23606_length_713_cov_1.314332_1_plen_77_part_01